MGKLTKEDIILLFLEDPKKLAIKIYNKQVPKSDEMRTLICELGNPDCAYWYALCIDNGPHFLTRKIACQTPARAFQYALYADCEPTEETRAKVQECSSHKRWYENWEKSLGSIIKKH